MHLFDVIYLSEQLAKHIIFNKTCRSNYLISVIFFSRVLVELPKETRYLLRKGKTEEQLNVTFTVGLLPLQCPFFYPQYIFPSFSPLFTQLYTSLLFPVYFNHTSINVKTLNLDRACREVS